MTFSFESVPSLQCARTMYFCNFFKRDKLSDQPSEFVQVKAIGVVQEHLPPFVKRIADNSALSGFKVDAVCADTRSQGYENPVSIEFLRFDNYPG